MMIIAVVGFYESVAPFAAALTLPIILFLRKRVSQPALVACGCIYFFITYYYVFFCEFNFQFTKAQDKMSEKCLSPNPGIIFKYGLVIPAFMCLIFFSVLILIARHGRGESLHRRSRAMASKDHDEE